MLPILLKKSILIKCERFNNWFGVVALPVVAPKRARTALPLATLTQPEPNVRG
jgi:hypothetical protein